VVSFGCQLTPEENFIDFGVATGSIKLTESGKFRTKTGWAEIVTYENERIEIQYKADRKSLLTVSDMYYPGWRATVDNMDVPVLRTNVMFRGVMVPEGQHKVTMIYEPPGRVASNFISWFALLALMGIMASSFRSGRHYEATM